MAQEGSPQRRRVLLITDIVLAIVDVALIIVVLSVGFDFPLGGREDGPEDGRAPQVAEEARDEAPPEEPVEDAATTQETDGDESAMEEGPGEEAAQTAEEPVATQERAQSPPPDAREVRRRYTVTEGDTFFGLAGRIWEDQHLWPDLYTLNRDGFPNPDLILPGETVDIYPSLKADGTLTDAELAALLEAYVDTYRRYRRIGEEALSRGRESGSQYQIQRGRLYVNKAQWLLYSGLRYSRDLLDRYAAEIDEGDLRAVRQYVERFGYVDP